MGISRKLVRNAAFQTPSQSDPIKIFISTRSIGDLGAF